jgi:hypothetical protein
MRVGGEEAIRREIYSPEYTNHTAGHNQQLPASGLVYGEKWDADDADKTRMCADQNRREKS